MEFTSASEYLEVAKRLRSFDTREFGDGATEDEVSRAEQTLGVRINGGVILGTRNIITVVLGKKRKSIVSRELPYEVGRARMSVSLLPALAQFFGIAVDELLGLKNGAAKRGPTPLLQRQIERLSRLPKTKQKVVMEMLEGVLSQTSR